MNGKDKNKEVEKALEVLREEFCKCQDIITHFTEHSNDISEMTTGSRYALLATLSDVILGSDEPTEWFEWYISVKGNVDKMLEE